MSNEVRNIYQRINDVIKKGLYIKRGSAGQGTGVLYDEVIALVGPHLAEAGIIFTVDKVGEARSRETKKGNYIYECDFNVHYINADNPSDKITMFVEAHAGDAGDKAPGKAITYAAKISLVKVFQIESGINDESREEVKEKTETITPEQQSELAEYCFSFEDPDNPKWTTLGNRLAKRYRISALHELLKKDFDAAITRCKEVATGAK